MNFDKRKFTYISVVAIIAAATLYVTFSLISYGSPTVKSQNEYLVEANGLHNDSLFEEAVEPYMKAAGFNEQRSLVNYNIATNSIMKNYPALSESFNNDGRLDAEIDSALVEAIARLDDAGEEQPDTARYSSVYHNMGVVNHMRNDLKEAAEAYKMALRKNPADEDARYNLAVVLLQMKNNDQQQNQQDQQQQQQNQQQEQQQQQEQKEEQKQQQQPQEEKEQQNQPQQPQEDKEKMEQMLKALMQDEKEIREKMEETEKAKAKRGIPEKNW